MNKSKINLSKRFRANQNLPRVNLSKRFRANQNLPRVNFESPHKLRIHLLRRIK